MDQQLAGRFEVFKRPDYDQQQRRILYIGKATDGAFDSADSASVAFENKGSAFWSFATKISKLANPTGDGRANLAWSNLFKQGVQRGNPSGEVAESQKEDAVVELRREMEELKPALIVLVTAGYFEEVARDAFEIAVGDGPDGLRETPVVDQPFAIWSRKAFGNFPPIVWMNHPERKHRAYTEAALEVIADVTGWRS